MSLRKIEVFFGIITVVAGAVWLVFDVHELETVTDFLGEIAEVMGIDRQQIIAVGDSIGDIEALEEAGLGVAMANAEEKVKLHADYIAPSVWEDGVAEVLEKFILARQEG